MARGIPEEIMVLEEQSRDTYENLVNCRRIMAVMNEENSRENGNIAGTRNAAASRIAIVTSSYHMKRTMRCVRKLGMTNVVAIPAETPPAKMLWVYLWEMLCWLDFLRKGY